METDKNQKFGVYTWAQAEQSERTALGLADGDQADALCLSGGGIRSAAFCLGVLQALDKQGVLDKFHYLSTVSGGGFIGSWLTRWSAERRKVAALAKTVQDTTLPPLDQLRRYTNFLTPQPGPFSLDTWQVIVLWIRNTLVNWIGFAPILLLTVCIPIFYFAISCVLAKQNWYCDSIRAGLCLVALIILCRSIYKACIDLPSHKHPDGDPAAFDRKDYGPVGSTITKRAVIFFLFWAAVVPLAEAPILGLRVSDTPAAALRAFPRKVPAPVPIMTIVPYCVAIVLLVDKPRDALCSAPKTVSAAAPNSNPLPRNDPFFWLHLVGRSALLLPIGSVLACLVAYGLAWRHVVNGPDYLIADNRMRQRIAFSRNFFSWVCSSIVSALILYLGIRLAFGIGVIWVAILGPLWVTGSDLLRTTVYVAVRHEGLRSDLDREWLARLSADKLRIALAAACIAAAALLMPQLLFDGDDRLRSIIVSVFGFATGPVVAKIASDARVAFQPKAPTGSMFSGLRTDLLIAAVALFFLIVVLASAGWLIATLDLLLSKRFGGSDPGFRVFACVVLATAAAASSLIVAVSRNVEINRFSLHAVYRNRIVRAFLGTARAWILRRPDRFTGFDPVDNIRVTDCAASVRPARLFPVINTTLNMTSSRDLIRADRKAESFTITPLHCGSGALSPPCCKSDDLFERLGAYVPTCCYAGGDERDTGPGDKMLGVSLGTAVAISGAAVSPNMGYHSSPLAAFVMTLFNLRLGAWLPNPAMREPDRTKMRRSSPRTALFAAFGELFGQTSDRGESVYLSDGGHFDNLGLYEMLRRRCSRIIVIDAGADPDFACADFGRVLSYAKVDLGVSIDFVPPLVIPGQDAWQQVRRGTIRYGDTADRGELLYIKPCSTAGDPAQIRAFAAGHADFPHTTTADQFFTGTVFESYRALGEFQAHRAFNAKPIWVIGSGKLTGLDAVFRRAAALKGSP